jgi:hypothetical protein
MSLSCSDESRASPYAQRRARSVRDGNLLMVSMDLPTDTPDCQGRGAHPHREPYPQPHVQSLSTHIGREQSFCRTRTLQRYEATIQRAARPRMKRNAQLHELGVHVGIPHCGRPPLNRRTQASEWPLTASRVWRPTITRDGSRGMVVDRMDRWSCRALGIPRMSDPGTCRGTTPRHHRGRRIRAMRITDRKLPPRERGERSPEPLAQCMSTAHALECL